MRGGARIDTEVKWMISREREGGSSVRMVERKDYCLVNVSNYHYPSPLSLF